MSESIIYEDRPTPEAPSERRVLVTGAAGRIGSRFAEACADRYELRLMVKPGTARGDLEDFGEVLEGELTDLPRLKELCNGVDTVVHLAADPSPKATWDSILPNNIDGTYKLFVASIAQGVRRVVYTSSIHAVSGYPKGYQVHPGDPVNPGDLYGVSKCFGEAMARYAATQHDLSSIVVRVGGFASVERAQKHGNLHLLNAFVSHRDLIQLLQRCIEDTRLRFAVFHGLSANVFNRMDISNAQELLGYAPQDDLSKLSPEVTDELHPSLRPHSEKGRGQKSGLRKDLEG